MAQPAYRTLGLTIPVADALDPDKWRQRYAFGIRAGVDREAGQAEIDAATNIPKSRMAARIIQCGGTEESALEAADLVGSLDKETIRWHLRAAMSELEIKLGISFGIIVYKSNPIDEGLIQGVDYDVNFPRRPYVLGEAVQWFRIDLPPNVISIERIRGYYFGQLVWDFSQNPDLIKLEWPKQGVLHMIPNDLQSIMIVNSTGRTSGNYGVWHTLQHFKSPVPDFWACDFTTGPVTKDGRVGQIEAVLAHWIYARASMLLLSMSGLAQSQGVTSASISMDGVSRSVGLQASAIYGLNSALEHAYDEVNKGIDWKALRAYKRGLRLKMYGY